MGRDFGIDPKRLSDNTKYNIDMQVNELLEFAFNQSYYLIKSNEKSFMKSVELLKEKRIISGDDVYEIIDEK